MSFFSSPEAMKTYGPRLRAMREAARKRGEITDAQFMLWMKRDHFLAMRYERRDH